MAVKRKKTNIDIGSRIKSVDDVNQKAKVLVWAENKVGKTTFAASAPNVLIIDINEEGTRSAKGTGAHVLEVRQWPEIPAAYWWLRDNHKEFESVALDTATAMGLLAMKHTLRESEKRDPHRQASTPDRQAWGKVKELMITEILRFRNLPMHVVFTAQSRREIDNETEELLSIGPDLAGGAKGTLMGACGVNGYLGKYKLKGRENRGKYKRVMRVGDHDIIKSGNRLEGALKPLLTNPTMADIIAAYQK